MNIYTRLIRAGMKRGWKKGFVEGDSKWAVVGAAALLSHLAGRAMHREPEVVFSEKLQKGQSIRITHEAEAPKRGKRRS